MGRVGFVLFVFLRRRQERVESIYHGCIRVMSWVWVGLVLFYFVRQWANERRKVNVLDGGSDGSSVLSLGSGRVEVTVV